jgi:hypothetical protein
MHTSAFSRKEGRDGSTLGTIGTDGLNNVGFCQDDDPGQVQITQNDEAGTECWKTEVFLRKDPRVSLGCLDPYRGRPALGKVRLELCRNAMPSGYFSPADPALSQNWTRR